MGNNKINGTKDKRVVRFGGMTAKPASILVRVLERLSTAERERERRRGKDESKK